MFQAGSSIVLVCSGLSVHIVVISDVVSAGSPCLDHCARFVGVRVWLAYLAADLLVEESSPSRLEEIIVWYYLSRRRQGFLGGFVCIRNLLLTHLFLVLFECLLVSLLSCFSFLY